MFYLCTQKTKSTQYGEYKTTTYRGEKPSCPLGRVINLQCCQERVPHARLHQCRWQHVLQSHPLLGETGRVLPHRARLRTYLPKWYHTVLLGRNKSQDHWPEVLGRLRLARLLRVLRQGAEHPDAEGLPYLAGKTARCSRQRPGRDGVLTYSHRRDSTQAVSLRATACDIDNKMFNH